MAQSHCRTLHVNQLNGRPVAITKIHISCTNTKHCTVRFGAWINVQLLANQSIHSFCDWEAAVNILGYSFNCSKQNVEEEKREHLHVSPWWKEQQMQIKG